MLHLKCIHLLSVVLSDCQTYPVLSNTDPNGNGSDATKAFLGKKNNVCVLQSETPRYIKEVAVNLGYLAFKGKTGTCEIWTATL